jgi:polysaccharide export outer membrane protein
MKRIFAVLAVSMVSILAMEGAQGQTAVATPNAAQQAASPTVNSETYVIGADDSLQVTVWKEPTLSGTFPVRPDGKISLVLLGDVPAAGKTATQLSSDIAQRLKKYVQDPLVTVVVLAVNSQKIFVIGEVGHVGSIMLTPGMTPLQAIASAGGLSTFANQKRVYILRGVPGKQQKIPFNYKKALKGDNSLNVSLQPGDTIVVP